MAHGKLQRLAVFTRNPAHGNPAGVWIGEVLPDASTMQRIAAEVGYSETVFISPGVGARRRVRYFSPAGEVSFCGHATIAGGVAIGHSSGAGTVQFETLVGDVAVDITANAGLFRAALTSVQPRFEYASGELLAATLEALGWMPADLDPAIPPARAYAGAWHLVLAAMTRRRLASLDYDFNRLRQIMTDDGLTTVQLVWREARRVFHSRNPFPVGGVVEDPATGAAAAALGGYLRDAGLIDVPGSLTIHQGEDMGRPGLLTVTIPETGGIVVSGTGVTIDE